jgi:hypothetical protein
MLRPVVEITGAPHRARPFRVQPRAYRLIASSNRRPAPATGAMNKNPSMP